MPDRMPGPTIAVVDDDRSVLESLGSLLESADYTVRLFPSAAALLDGGDLARLDCLISDIGMADMDGIALMGAARSQRPGLPVILITGRPDLLNRIPPSGPAPYRLFLKPFMTQDLLGAVGDALRDARSRAGAP